MCGWDFDSTHFLLQSYRVGLAVLHDLRVAAKKNNKSHPAFGPCSVEELLCNVLYHSSDPKP